jgi:hypothetical protein
MARPPVNLEAVEDSGGGECEEKGSQQKGWRGGGRHTEREASPVRRLRKRTARLAATPPAEGALKEDSACEVAALPIGKQLRI